MEYQSFNRVAACYRRSTIDFRQCTRLEVWIHSRTGDKLELERSMDSNDNSLISKPRMNGKNLFRTPKSDEKGVGAIGQSSHIAISFVISEWILRCCSYMYNSYKILKTFLSFLSSRPFSIAFAFRYWPFDRSTQQRVIVSFDVYDESVCVFFSPRLALLFDDRKRRAFERDLFSNPCPTVERLRYRSFWWTMSEEPGGCQRSNFPPNSVPTSAGRAGHYGC